MRRILVVHCPIARSTPGSSFGPMTISATTPTMTSSPHAMSYIAFPLRTPPLPLGDREKRITPCRNLAAVKQRPRSGRTSAELSARPSLGGFVSALLTGRARLPASPMVDCLRRIVLGRVDLGRIALVVVAVRHA